MRKSFILCLLLIFAFSSVAFAATKARTLSLATNVEKAYAIGDASSGDTAEVDDDGSVSVKEYPKSLAVLTTGTDGTLVATACTVYGIVVSGSPNSCYTKIYDNTYTTGTPKFSIRSTGGTTETVMIPGGATFSTGVQVDVLNATDDVTVIYDT